MNVHFSQVGLAYAHMRHQYRCLQLFALDYEKYQVHCPKCYNATNEDMDISDMESINYKH